MQVDRRHVLAGLAAVTAASTLAMAPVLASGPNYTALLDHGYAVLHVSQNRCPAAASGIFTHAAPNNGPFVISQPA
jgi:hypothetical protein